MCVCVCVCACAHTHVCVCMHIVVTTDLLVVDLRSSLAYFMMTHPLPVAGKLPIKTLVTRQLPTNVYVCVHVCVCVQEHMRRRSVQLLCHQNTNCIPMQLTFLELVTPIMGG